MGVNDSESIHLVISVTSRQESEQRTPPRTIRQLTKQYDISIQAFTMPAYASYTPYQAAQLLYSDDKETRNSHRGSYSTFAALCNQLESYPVDQGVRLHADYYNPLPTKQKCFHQSATATPYANSFMLVPTIKITSDNENIAIHESDLSQPLPKEDCDSKLVRKQKKNRRYKPVAKKINTVPATMPSEYRTIRKIEGDPLSDLPTLSTIPSPFVPMGRYTEERMKIVDERHQGFLWPQERMLMHNFMMFQNGAFAWNEQERGQFREDFFPPIRMPVMAHTPWQLKNMPIPPGIYDKVLEAVRKKIEAGVYEPSNSSYRSRWFTVAKKDGTLRLVHDLQPLNAVTIRDAGVPPFTETVAEACGGRACYGILDLLVGYDHRKLHPDSRDLTTFQSPLGTFRLTTVPMGWGNSVPIFQADVTFILQPEIPDNTIPFLDDASVLGPRSRYETPDGSYETLPENTGIRRFVWEHFQTLNRIVQRMKYVGGTWSGPKSILCAPEVLIVGHLCCYEGRKANTTHVDKIRNWGACEEVSDVRAFLGTAGLMRIFIKDYARIAWPLTKLTRHTEPFRWEREQEIAQNTLRKAIINSPAIRAINYKSDAIVILAVDTSYIAIGYVLMQCDENRPKVRYPSRFGSMVLNERETNYSQPKLELYGLFRALRAVRLYIIGVKNLHVEVDAKYIKGMINNPDIQPNATINRWIAGILLFTFILVHVPGITHGPDGMSRRKPQPNDVPSEDDQDDHESDEWLDRVYGMWNLCLPLFYIGRSKNKFYSTLSTLTFFNKNEETNNEFYINFKQNKQQAIDNFGYTGNSVLYREVHVYATELPDFSESTTHKEVEIPRSEKQIQSDQRLNDVIGYLENLATPPDYTEKQIRNLIRYSSRFFIKDSALYRRKQDGPRIVIPPSRRLIIMNEAHDLVGHKGFLPTFFHIRIRFWWPSMGEDIKWYTKTCHECQKRQVHHINRMPIVQEPAPLFAKVYIDFFKMEGSSGFKNVIHARCSLTSYPEAKPLKNEGANGIQTFIFENLICRWGSLIEVVTDNAQGFRKVLDEMSVKFRIGYIRISKYNHQANGIIESPNSGFRQSLYKACETLGWGVNKWYQVFHHVLWAERITHRRGMGCSPYFAAHGIHPLLPFDITEATTLLPAPDSTMTPQELVGRRAAEFIKRTQQLETIRDRVFEYRKKAMEKFVEKNFFKIRDYQFERGDLVLVRNTRYEMSHNRKKFVRWLGPYIFLAKNRREAIILCDLAGTVHRDSYATFRIIPYFPRKAVVLPAVEGFLDITPEQLDVRIASEDDDPEAGEDDYPNEEADTSDEIPYWDDNEEHESADPTIMPEPPRRYNLRTRN
jgi:hypothetical protein